MEVLQIPMNDSRITQLMFTLAKISVDLQFRKNLKRPGNIRRVNGSKSN